MFRALLATLSFLVILVLPRRAAQIVQAMLANETQVANTSGSAPINAKLKGADTVIIASSYDLIRFIDTLYTR
jgi:ABC-type nitrate/sulfonate/bicarbonate transport system substrate-binding protein